jgi:hypothetical protein
VLRELKHQQSLLRSQQSLNAELLRILAGVAEIAHNEGIIESQLAQVNESVEDAYFRMQRSRKKHRLPSKRTQEQARELLRERDALLQRLKELRDKRAELVRTGGQVPPACVLRDVH